MTILPRFATREDLVAVVALQHAAYASGRTVTGVEALPLRADYDDIFARMECWVVDGPEHLDGALILELRDDDMLIWSVSTHPHARSRGVGTALLAFAERRARESGRDIMRLYTNERLTRNVAWYARSGYIVERIEDMPDRRAVHMKKILGGHA